MTKPLKKGNEVLKEGKMANYEKVEDKGKVRRGQKP
jgi:hypothetical protein